MHVPVYLYLFCLHSPLSAPLLHRPDSEAACRISRIIDAISFVRHVIVEIILNAQLEKRHDKISQLKVLYFLSFVSALLRR